LPRDRALAKEAALLSVCPQMSPQELAPWLERIDGAQRHVQSETGAIKLGLYRAAAGILSSPRLGNNGAPPSWPALQKPWFPFWPRLSSKPLHDPADFAWTRILRDAHRDIVDELGQVTERFGRAAYDSKIHNKPWNTYYFYLRSQAFADHLRDCPRTAEALAQLPTNRFHVCFSAIQPGGHLAPHTGPTNTSLTVHLGLANCDGARLFVADEQVAYRDGEVLIFDDSYVHWVEHAGAAIRYTLMVTIWHPELNAAERAFLQQAAKLIRT
jgi:aspartyl/asparaginyl beta-hydroxylase (cupin superfamily)